jgi:alkylation response protein AidB-like acyl-CoA dehydrogenase
VAGSDVMQVEAGAHNAAAKYLNFRKTSIYGGSNEVQRSIISATILGL